jgi:putative MATE family efflux protein
VRDPAGRRWDRRIIALAIPAFGALIVQPLFLLIDAAVVGTLGTAPLAGLGIASTVVGTIFGLAIFLAYGTTASVSRRFGASDVEGAVGEAIDGMALGLGLGVLVGLGLGLAAPALAGAFGAPEAATAQAVTYLHVVALAMPFGLAALAGVGALRGLQDTRTTFVVSASAVAVNAVLCVVLVMTLHRGIGGSAAATVVAEAVAAVGYLFAVRQRAKAAHVRMRPTRSGLLAGLRDGIPIFWRTGMLRASLLLATAAAAHLGTQSLAAYQVTFTVWYTLNFALDAMAIAAQALVGSTLGSGDASGARVAAKRVTQWGMGFGVVLALVLLALTPLIPDLFTQDQTVRTLIIGALPIVAAQQLLAGPVTSLDGVLLGAGDFRFLAIASTIVFVAYAPAVVWVMVSHAGLNWLWVALAWWLLVRLVLLAWRARGPAWSVVGTSRPASAGSAS